MLPLEIEQYLRPSGRPRELVLGLIVGLLALVFLYFGTYVLVVGTLRGLFAPPFPERGKLEFLIVPAVLLSLGLPFAWIAIRLLAARRRKDGGLFSPLVLRISGAVMVAIAILAIADAPRKPQTWSDAVTLTTMATACWVLAARRSPKDPDEPVAFQPRATPVD